ncbi:tRNA pseudouridine synthase A [Brumimicrobium aurantiacum]|uniref:tRNA pseudouridine synthase A n=1 Tax=Brumimicrobium aurantiacum TaxID=1737063 RepID=A0A3E1F1Z2_9FLAO|nr:tRNA pseudouridine(38-40) synthase TruA [Brumimicrobium aurantiacum]RFC55759.1 tRNA pseudouridine(38-40) synthase TruA [Brumimicrobium aurantiacum]
MRTRFYYLMEIQYLGFRYHGWQKQPNVITVQEMITKTLNWVLPDETSSKVLAAGRTDAKVSVNQTYVEVFTDRAIEDLPQFLDEFNLNLPADVKALSIEPTDAKFNIIQSEKIKEYHYYFAFGEKFHPYCAAFMCNILADLDVEIMQKAATMFVGKKDFYSYTFRPNPETQTNGEVISCELTKNTELTASFFPEESYVVKVKGIGFKRNQIRLMMGMLFELGQGKKAWSEFLATLDGSNRIKLSYNAPASGLQLHAVEFVNS